MTPAPSPASSTASNSPSPSPSSKEEGHSINWVKGFSGKAEDQTMDVKKGEVLKFVWTNHTHNVFLMKDKAAFDACDFSTGTNLGGTSPVYYTMGAATTYFACQVGTHCLNGQKLSAVIAGGTGGGGGGGGGVAPSPSTPVPASSPDDPDDPDDPVDPDNDADYGPDMVSVIILATFTDPLPVSENADKAMGVAVRAALEAVWRQDGPFVKGVKTEIKEVERLSDRVIELECAVVSFEVDGCAVVYAGCSGCGTHTQALESI